MTSLARNNGGVLNLGIQDPRPDPGTDYVLGKPRSG